jgi:hypothetical protein
MLIKREIIYNFQQKFASVYSMMYLRNKIKEILASFRVYIGNSVMAVIRNGLRIRRSENKTDKLVLMPEVMPCIYASGLLGSLLKYYLKR